MGAFINAIGTANPANKYSQETIAQFMCEHLPMTNEEKHKLQVMYRATGVHYRYSVLDDYKKRKGTFTFYENSPDLDPFPSTSKRMSLYREKALPLAIAAVTDCLQTTYRYADFTHLITVSCTGMYAPGLDVDLIKALNLSNSIVRNSLNFMGCYAAMNALNLAKQYCDNDQKARVLIVSVELCTLHLQQHITEDNLMAQALFSDGAAAVIVTGDSQKTTSLEILSASSYLSMDGKNDMAWQIGDFGFQMGLTSFVPKIIEGGIKKLTKDLLTKELYQLEDIDLFAIHPGGKKILEAVENQLGLTKDQNKIAYDVLKNYGNMSSPTILFVLNKVLKSIVKGSEKKILSFAFGPGLTMESILFKGG
jgi:predicted naringenin-chalcone synthase